MKLLKSGIRINNTVMELIVGDILYYVAGQILILVFAQRRLYVSIGYLCGVMISIFMLVNMAIAMEEAMSLKAKGADKPIRKTPAWCGG